MASKVITLLLILSTLTLVRSKKHPTKGKKDEKAGKEEPQMVKVGPLAEITNQVLQEFNDSNSQQVKAPTPNIVGANTSPVVAVIEKTPKDAPKNPLRKPPKNPQPQQRSPIVEANANKKAEDAVILKIDNLAKGLGKILGMKEPTKTSKCEARYKPDDTPKLTLKLILDDIFLPGMIPLRTSSRGFIEPIKFDFGTEQQKNATLVVTNCGKQRTIKLMNFRTSTSITPVKWMTVEETSLDIVEINYDEIVNQKAGRAWNAMKIKGYGKIRLGKDGSKINDDKYLIVFQKEMSPPGSEELVDTDMKIRVENTAIDRYEIKASDFLAMHGKKAAVDLYPKGNTLKIDCVTNEELTIEQSHGNDPIIVGSVADKSSYSVYLTGTVKYCDDLQGSDVDIICQNDFSNVVSCALLALIDTSSPKQFKAFEKSGLNNLGDMIFTDLAKKAHLFNGRIPDRLLFQTSRTAISQLNEELQDKLYRYVINENKRDPELPSQPNIIADFCFRYKLDNIGSKYPNLRNSLNIQVLVSACPGLGHVKFYLPDIGLVAIDQIPLLVTTFKQEDKFREWFKEQKLEIAYIEARDSEVEIGSYKYVFNLKPPGYVFAKGFGFIVSFPFLHLLENPIYLTRDVSPEVTFAGSGEEKILGNLAKFKLEQDDIGPSITVNLETTSSFFLIQAFKDVKGLPYIFDETNNDSYITPFAPLKKVTLTTLGTTAHAGDDSLSIVGDALLGNESNVEFELHLTYTPRGNVRGRSCVFKRDAIVADFINAARGSNLVGQSWIKSQNIGLMFLPSFAEGRTDCEMDPCCISNPEQKWSDNGNKQYVGVKMQDIEISQCGKDAKVSDGCKFLNRVFKDRESINVILTGYMNKNTLSVSGQTENEMSLGPDIVMSATPPINIRLYIQQSEKVKKDYITLTGWLTFQNNRANNFYSRVIVAGENVMLQILSGPEYMPIPDIFNSAFVRLASTLSRRICISPNEPLKEIEINAPLKIGFDSEHQIVFEDQNSIKLSIDPKTGKASKFYACREGKHPVPIRELLSAFNGMYVYGLLDKSEIRGLCVTYHQGKSKWNITELGLNVKPGLRISGLLASHYGKRRPKGETYHMKVDMDLSIEETSSNFCVVLPVLQWGVQERTVEGRKIEAAMMEMFYSEESQTQGPLYCFKLPKQKGGIPEASMKGYIKSFAFEAPATIQIGSADPRFPGNLYHYTFDYHGKLFNELGGRLKLEADYTEQDPFKINFKISIDQLNLDTVQKSLDDYTNEKVKTGGEVAEKAGSYFGKFTSWVNGVKDGIGKVMDIWKKQKKEFTKVKLERARAIQAFKKDCSTECGYVRVPGFKVENQCGRSSNGRSLRCVNYVEDAHVASNVGCVASCEAERVKSSENAAKLDTIARAEGSNVDKSKSCYQIGRKLREKLQGMKNFLKDNNNKFKSKVAKLKRLKNLDSKKFKLSDLRMSIAADDIKDPRCFRFDWESVWDWDRGADKEWGVSKRRQVFRNITRCFNGFFVKNITEYTMNKRYLVNELMKLEKQVTSVDGKYLMFDKIINKTGGNSKSRDINKMEGDFDKCVKDNTKAAALKRSIIDTMAPIKGGMFTIFHKNTVDSFNKRSPWAVSKRKDALHRFVVSERRGSIQNSTLSAHAQSTCSIARRSTIDYSDIANYIHKWIKEQKTAKEVYATVKSTINREVEKSDNKLSGLQTNLSTDAVDLLRYWQDRAKSGMERWLSTEEARIAKHNSESIPLIRKELEFIYTNKEYPTLDEFINRRSSDGSNALKKANIATPDGNSFAELSKTLVSVLKDGSNLDQLSGPVEDVLQRIEGLHKRTILCTS